jgi:two-component system sensor histidine kinase HydH
LERNQIEDSGENMGLFPATKFLANIRLRYVVIITVLLGLILFAIAFFGIRQSKSGMLNVMAGEGEALLETLIMSSQNAVRANALVEELVGERLKDIAHLIDQMDQSGLLNDSRLESLVRQADLSRIDVLNRQAAPVYSSDRSDREIYEDTAIALLPALTPILQGDEEEATFGIEATTLLAEKSYAAAVRRSKGQGAVVVVASAAYLESFKKEIGIGYLIQKIGQQSGVDYIVLQSSEGIVLASRQVGRMLKIEEDPFLQSALEDQAAQSRITSFEDKDVLEVVKAFESEEIPSGLFRVGLSLEGYRQVAWAFQKQMMLYSAILFFLGLLIIGMVIVNQNYFVLQRSYRDIKTLTGNVLESMHSAVVVVNQEGKIVVLNRLAEDLFGVSRDHAVNRDYSVVFPQDTCLLLPALAEKRTSREVEIRYRTLSGEEKTLIIGTSCLFDENKEFKGAVAVIHDVTELKKYEEEAKRAERLSAMGNLAAGVAHEIRNPLNAISITAQRLGSEFVPKKDLEEYKSFTQLILNEIKRLDDIINQFLSLAKAHELNLAPVDMSGFLNELVDLAQIEADQRGINVNRSIDRLAEIRVDREELKKALLNIMLNGIQATDSGGTLAIRAHVTDDHKLVVIEIEDSGKGIPPERLSRIFQPYFSTKEKGTGLGLSIAYRIVSDHRGKIEVTSEVGKGTVFTVKLPVT